MHFIKSLLLYILKFTVYVVLYTVIFYKVSHILGYESFLTLKLDITLAISTILLMRPRFLDRLNRTNSYNAILVVVLFLAFILIIIAI